MKFFKYLKISFNKMPSKVKKINIKEKIKNLQKKLQLSVSKFGFFSKLKKYDDFFESESWKEMEKSKEGHDMGYNIVKSILGSIKVSFYDKGEFTHDDYNMKSEINGKTLEILDYLDRKQLKGIFRVGKYLIKNIGSSSITEYGVGENGIYTVEKLCWGDGKNCITDYDYILYFDDIDTEKIQGYEDKIEEELENQDIEDKDDLKKKLNIESGCSADEISPELKTKMDKSRILTKINLEKILTISETKMLKISKRLNSAKSYLKIDELIKSDLWKQMEKSVENEKRNHDFLYSAFSSILGDKSKILFYDHDFIINDHKNLWNELSEHQKQFIKYIDNNKNEGTFRLDGLVVQYIGSTSAYVAEPADSTDKTYEFEEDTYWDWNWEWDIWDHGGW